MVDWVGVLFGSFVALSGVLSAINHPIVDGFNRWSKSVGTDRRPSQIEMSHTSVLVGRAVGILLVLVGAVIVSTALR